MYAEVAVDAPAGFNRTFSYSIPSSLHLSPGFLVTVPFGSRTLLGIVFSLEPSPQVPETKDVLDCVSPTAVLAPHQLHLARWVSRYYMAPLFESASLMLPPRFKSGLKEYVALGPSAGSSSESELTDSEKRALAVVGKKAAAVERRSLLKSLGRGGELTLRGLIQSGHLRQYSRWNPQSIRRVTYASLPQKAKPDWKGVIDDLAKGAPKQAQLVEFLALQERPVPLPPLRKAYGQSAVKGLQDKGLLEVRSVPAEKGPISGRTFPCKPTPTLSEDQQSVVSRISGSIHDPSASDSIFLLHGITGSGKTEVYMQSVEACVKMGRSAIVLVPEISLTPQAIERFASRFPDQVAVIHSRLSNSQLAYQWWNIKGGHYAVVVGSRSALFAPQPGLGLVVVDEEHEWTYKQHDQSPRYHARGIAFKLAELTGATVILGSATPDVTSYHHALRKKIDLVELPHRIIAGESIGSGLPQVRIVDMRQELREGNRSVFSRILLSEMESTMERRQQIILFLNRRGSASYVQCRDCGRTVQCSRCEVALTYHGEIGRLLCHYCNKRTAMPRRCLDCQSSRIWAVGLGTQSVVERVREEFPGVRVLRWDRDATRNPKAHQDLLTRFESGEADVLVGTQMIAKGLHIPSVTLVGVVLADSGLGAPDFRSGERAFQVLSQISGRAGRGVFPGSVIIQTFQPHHYAVLAAARQNYRDFYNEEIEYRRQQGNPPFNRLILLLYAHTNLAVCQREAVKLFRTLTTEREALGLSDVDILGPAPAFPARVRGRYRWHIILRGQRPEFLLGRVSIPQGWIIDVDPVTTT